jgi:hypothetical protein
VGGWVGVTNKKDVGCFVRACVVGGCGGVINYACSCCRGPGIYICMHVCMHVCMYVCVHV